MLPYWLLWAFFFFGAILTQRRNMLHSASFLLSRQPGSPEPERLKGLSIMAVAGLAAMILMIGLRFEVGADWKPYDYIFRRAALRTFSQTLSQSDPGFALLNWLVQQSGLGIWLVNLVCGALTVWGVAALARREPQPWLCIVLAIPYLIVVVAMGYTRQAAALGLVMVGLASLLNSGSVVRLVMWVALAALFHKSAVICLPFVAFTGNRGKAVDLALLASAGLGLYALLLQDSVDMLVRNYIDARYSSSGAAIRISMSAMPAIIFLLLGRRLGFTESERKLWRNVSLVAIIAAVALVLSPSSTAVDRVALYLLPLQFVVLARVPDTLVGRNFGTWLVSLYSGAVLFTWLNFAVHAQYWVPYRSWLGA